MKTSMSPRLDFTARPRIASPVGWMLLLAGGAFALAAMIDWQAERDATAHWEDKAAQHAWTAQRAGRGGAAGEELRPQALAAAKALSRLALPWNDLFGGLETNAGGDISLLAVLPNAEKGELRLSGEARDFAALRAYLQRLGASGILADVRLLNHEVRESDAQKPVVFSVIAAWRIPS